MAAVAACNNLGAAARDKREREIEREVSREMRLALLVMVSPQRKAMANGKTA